MSWVSEIVAGVELVELVSSSLMPVVTFDSFSLRSPVFEVLILLFVVSLFFLCTVCLVFSSCVSFLFFGMDLDTVGSQVA